ncbi:MAG: RadC family protein [Rickettsiaceae bacterium]
MNLKIIKELINRVLANQVLKQNVIGSWSALLEYLKFNMSNLRLEQFRVLFLNKKNILIADEIMATGTIDQTPVYPREIIKRILIHEAGAIILVHNHPSGNTKPSNSDIDLTTQIVNACKTVNVSVHDHVIIGKGEFYSFKTNMLL